MAAAPEAETYFIGHDVVSCCLFPDLKTRLVKSNISLIVQAFQVDLLRSLCESFVEGFTVTFPYDYAQLKKLDHIYRRLSS
jgi:hypothetical protein